jgi:pyrroloquinoline quinone biosynthesis protein B
LWPQPGADGRRSPITDVILTGAEVDQAVGLLLLREFHRFHIHATAAVRRLLTEDNSLFGVLARFEGQATWRDIPLEAPFTAGGACLEAIPLAGGLPGFASPARVAASNPDEAVIGVLMAPAAGGGTLAFLPGIGQVSDALLERLDRCEALLFDGTFWSDDEPMRIPGINRTARAMGHMPISGECGTLNRLKDVRRPRKIFIHINNTNPILDEDSEEHQQVRAAGWEIARDGMEVEL